MKPNDNNVNHEDDHPMDLTVDESLTSLLNEQCLPEDGFIQVSKENDKK